MINYNVANSHFPLYMSLMALVINGYVLINNLTFWVVYGEELSLIRVTDK